MRATDTIPTPTQARATARRMLPRAEFRADPVWDLGWDIVVAGACTTYDHHTPRLWGPRGRR